MTDLVLKRSRQARSRLIRAIEDLSAVFGEMDRLVRPDNIWHLAQFHRTLHPDGHSISFKPSGLGAQIHIMTGAFAMSASERPVSTAPMA